jgi:hypothetical protein
MHTDDGIRFVLTNARTSLIQYRMSLKPACVSNTR